MFGCNTRESTKSYRKDSVFLKTEGEIWELCDQEEVNYFAFLCTPKYGTEQKSYVYSLTFANQILASVLFTLLWQHRCTSLYVQEQVCMSRSTQRT